MIQIPPVVNDENMKKLINDLIESKLIELKKSKASKEAQEEGKQ